MAAKNRESLLWQKLKKGCPEIFFTRIESSTINGIPDVHAVSNNSVFWIELKSDYVSYPKLNKWQIVWINKYIKAGGKVFILVEALSEGVLKLYEPVSVFTDPRLLKPRSRFSLTGQWPAIQAELLAPAQQRSP
jgi:Holliday junction resolvase